jgi:hypothetical protein
MDGSVASISSLPNKTLHTSSEETPAKLKAEITQLNEKIMKSNED